MTHLEVVDALADLLHLPGALEAEDEGRLGRGVDGALPHHQVLEVQTAENKQHL